MSVIKTRKLLNTLDNDQLVSRLERLLWLCQPDKICLARKVYKFRLDKTTIEEALADAILLEM